jgi:phospholipid/cholesterol/gamma-HCH transport system permease protein
VRRRLGDVTTTAGRGDASATADVDLHGNLDVHAAGRLFGDLQRLSRRSKVARVRIDLAAVDSIDSAGAAALITGRRALEQAGKTVELRGVSSAHEAVLELRRDTDVIHGADGPPSWLERVGEQTRSIGRTSIHAATLSVDTAASAVRCLLRRERMPRGSFVEQAVTIGVDALPIVALLSFLLGTIMAFQSAVQLRTFGAELYTADLVGLGMVREFGSFITAIILAGRSGAAIAAELGTMAVNEEIDALRTMGIPPVRFLVLPRMLAIACMQPALSLLAMFVGIAGGLAIAPTLGLSWLTLYHRMTWIITPNDLALGLSKSVLFAWAIGLAACTMGLRTRGGATSVGVAATRSVVAGIFLIIVIDSIVTSAWTLGRNG